MKRFLCLVLTVALMLALTGCSALAEMLHGLAGELRDMTDTCDWIPQDPDATVSGWDSLISGLPGSILPGMEDPSATQSAGGIWPGEEDVIITVPAAQEDLLPLDSDCIQLTFSSGVGNWGTIMVLNRDGSFEGEFFDMNMGDTGDDHPYGTMWCCSFYGEFKNFVQINENTWSLKLHYLEMDREAGETWIEDGIQYIASTPYGLEDSEEFWLLLPDAPAEVLPEDAVIRWPYFSYAKEDRPDTISCYGLLNMESNYTFFSSIYGSP